MTSANLKSKVEQKLISWGNNPTDVSKMIEAHFDYASRKYSTVVKISECIRTIY